MTTAFNLICGPLGSGKTTLIRHLLSQKPEHEHWLLVVNEFGAVGIDGAILQSQNHTRVAQIPGGCICCTAKGEVEATLKKQIAEHKPDRILLEPTGLGEPDNLVDLIRFADFKDRIDIQAVVTVLDSAHTEIADIERMTIYQSLLNMADVVVLNKTDLAEPARIDALQNLCQTCFPPKEVVVETTQGRLPLEAIRRAHFTSPAFSFAQGETEPFSPGLVKTHFHAPTAADLPPVQNLPGLVERQGKHQGDTVAIGWIFEPDVAFDWQALRTLFEQLATNGQVKRAKGVFGVGASSRMLFQLAQGEVTRELIAYRKDSRLELLLTNADAGLVTQLERSLQAAITAS
ncbi:MAG: GTP-binding protein [Hydrogenovibrio sp.]|uniref:CobW family GTP-binding protein n=1 Tax=Hydrogenovibrio sp. TaxID=2065821 RepID=UPI0028700621|nr:GTP-binding protein [Hydrogenovibrio sp.]MDR9499005.1 GTP-binding protein [Hydrogenovibrio sp.]